MANLLCPEDIEWKFIMSMAFSDCHHSKSVNEKYGLEMEVITKKKDNYTFGNAKVYYFITNQEKEYTDLQELCDDWNEIKNFDDPENEIVWVKKIVKTIKIINEQSIMKKEQEIKKMKQEDNQTFTSDSTIKIILPSTAELSHKPSEYVENKNEDIIMINRSEYETLKKRYGIAKTALEAVLCFIVPQNLRDLVNKAMIDIKKADEFKENF